MEEQGFALEIALRQGYELGVDFGLDGVPDLVVDEPPPLGRGKGPNAARLLGAAVGSCMSASLLYCLRRARIDVPGLRATVRGTLERNERGRLRIAGLTVTIHPEIGPDDVQRTARCRELFEDFCVVGESVRRGIPVTVEVEPAMAVPAGVAPREPEPAAG